MNGRDIVIAGHYPETPRIDVVDNVAGVRVVDHYRWLEDENDRVHQWQEAQARLASATIAAAGDLPLARRVIEEHAAGSRPPLPRRGGSRWFRATQGLDGVELVVADEPYGEGRPLVRLADLDVGSEAAVLSWLAPSPDGTVLAFGVCTDGSEHNRIQLVDVDTGRLHSESPSQLLHSAWAGGVSWSAGGRDFHYFALK